MYWIEIFWALAAFYAFRTIVRFIVALFCEIIGLDHRSFLKTFF